MAAAIKEHNIIERKIKSDIILKNTIRKRLARNIRKVSDWAERVEKANNNRIKSKFEGNIERYLPMIRDSRKVVLGLIEDLERRIVDEMKFSKKEMEELKAAKKKEYEELVAAQKLLLKAGNGTLSDEEISEITGKSIEDIVAQREAASAEEKGKKPLFAREFLLAKAEKIVKAEKKDADSVEEELSSEEKDKKIFERELARMALEREILS